MIPHPVRPQAAHTGSLQGVGPMGAECPAATLLPGRADIRRQACTGQGKRGCRRAIVLASLVGGQFKRALQVSGCHLAGGKARILYTFISRVLSRVGSGGWGRSREHH
jgi:hypothetical protein